MPSRGKSAARFSADVLAVGQTSDHHNPVTRLTSDRPRSHAGYAPGVAVFANPSFFERIAGHTTGEFPVVVGPLAPVAPRQRLGARGSPDPSTQRRALRDAIRAVADRLDAVSQAALESSTAAAWVNFWQEKFLDFVEDSRTLRHLVQLSGIPKEILASHESASEGQIMQIFPDSRHELKFLLSMMRRSHRTAVRFADRPVADKDREADAGYAQDFNYWSDWFSICMSQLAFLADSETGVGATEVAGEVVSQIFELARTAAIEVNHASMQAASLRRDIAPAADGPSPTPIHVEDGDLADVEAAIRRLEGAP